MKKNLIMVTLVILLCMGSLFACSNEVNSSSSKDDTEGLSVVCTIFPQYDWVKEILGKQVNNVELTLLLENGVDLHSYQPTAKDIANIATCDLFIYVGGESDGWVEDALAEATNKDMQVINLLEVLGSSVKEEEVVEGMEEAEEETEEEVTKAAEEVDEEEPSDEYEDNHEDGNTDGHEDENTDDHEDEYEDENAIDHEADHEAEHEDEHEDENADDHEDEHEDENADDHEDEHENENADEHEHEHEYDEHVWLSLKNAQVICDAICTSLSELDADNRDAYENNLEIYKDKLTALDTDYQETTDNAARSAVLFGDRFPFRYMMDDYGIDYYAAFVGCSAETEASFRTIVFLAQKVQELELPVVCVLERADQSIARTIINNTQSKDQKVLVMDSMQSVTAEDISNGASYLSFMKDNLKVLKEALN
jgi:zinc transport system substrate-binding protein